MPGNEPGRGKVDGAARSRQQLRTCVGCRRKDERSVLLRVVAPTMPSGQVRLVLDVKKHLPGRGCWLHPDVECFDLAVRRRAFARALRISGPVNTGDLRGAVQECQHDGSQHQESRKRV